MDKGWRELTLVVIISALVTVKDYLRPIYMTEDTRLYEIVGFPP